MNDKRVFICTTTRFPDGDAGSIYYTNLSKCISDNPKEILFVGNGLSEYKKIVKDENTNLDYISLRSAKKSLVSRIFSHIMIKRRIISFIFKNYKSIDSLVLDGSFSLKQYKRICFFFKKNKPSTKIIIGVLEKYSQDEFEKTNIFVKKMIKNNNEFIAKFNDDKPVLVVISSFLEKIFKGRGLKCVRVPFIFESSKMIGAEEKRVLTQGNEKISIVYAGRPSKKDLVINILDGFALLSESELEKVFFNVAGIDYKWLCDNGLTNETWSRISKSVKLYGQIAHSQVEEIHKKSDYSILVRDENKCFAKAGFPTKISESLYYSTIPITNLTSDLATYLEDEKNAIIIKGSSPEDIKEAIQRAVEIHPKIEKMRIESCKTLKESLSVEHYRGEIRDILN